VLASGVLLAVGVMTTSQPAKDAWAELTRGVAVEQRAEDLRLRLRVNPATPGFNGFSLRIDDRNGRPVVGANKVALILSHLEHEMGENEVVLEPQGGGLYAAETGLASMVGKWRAEALVRRDGRDDVRAAFDFTLEDPALSVVAQPDQAGQAGQAYTGTPVAPAAARQIRNPVPPTEASLAQGRQIYQQNCMVCHGVGGRGDGPAARTLRPPPADLAQHVAAHTEGELWWWITNGVAGTPMPAWRTVLSDVERWHVLNYIKDAFAPATQ
jgi:mono/diheme cytochrome c family protein